MKLNVLIFKQTSEQTNIKICQILIESIQKKKILSCDLDKKNSK